MIGGFPLAFSGGVGTKREWYNAGGGVLMNPVGLYENGGVLEGGVHMENVRDGYYSGFV